MISRLAIVPARGGSKRIPGKNIRNFAGRPMITHILSAARESGLFSKIHVSTEDKEIREISENAGFSVEFPRPPELADDHTPIMPVLRHVAETYASRGERFDEIWLLMACAPLVEADDLLGAARIMETLTGKKAVLAVSEYPAPVEWAFAMAQDHTLVPLQPGMFAKRSQDLEKRYYDTGTFIAFPAASVLDSTGAGTDSGFSGYALPKMKAVDIDTVEDWEFAEQLYRLLHADR